MTITTVLTFTAGAALNIALLAYGARRLLGERRFSLPRTVLAGLAGQAVGNEIINALAAGLPTSLTAKGAPSLGVVIGFIALGWACALLIAMAILVVWQAFIPAGTVPSPASWPGRLRARAARSARYWQIVRIFTRCGLGPLLRSGVAERFGQAQLQQRLGAAGLKAAATDELVALMPMLRRLPRRVDRIAAALEGGRLSVNARPLADERDRRTIDGWIQLGVLTVLAATAGIMAVALLALRGGPAMTAKVGFYQFRGYCLLVICALLALRVLAAVFCRT